MVWMAVGRLKKVLGLNGFSPMFFFRYHSDGRSARGGTGRPVLAFRGHWVLYTRLWRMNRVFFSGWPDAGKRRCPESFRVVGLFFKALALKHFRYDLCMDNRRLDHGWGRGQSDI